MRSPPPLILDELESLLGRPPHQQTCLDRSRLRLGCARLVSNHLIVSNRSELSARLDMHTQPEWCHSDMVWLADRFCLRRSADTVRYVWILLVRVYAEPDPSRKPRYDADVRLRRPGHRITE